MTCPTPTAGTVSNFTGSLGGSLFLPVDAYTYRSGINYSWQEQIVVSDKVGVAEHYRLNQRVAGERWILLALVAGDLAWNDAPNPPATPEQPFRIVQNEDRYWPEGGTVAYSLVVNRILHSARCQAQQAEASSGYVDLTEVSAARIAGHLDLWWGTEHVTGDFVAPALSMAGCPARPSKTTCVSG